jgi:diguanylate cyclase (GGDEF)-like protein
MVNNIPEGSYAASDSIEVTAQQVAEHAAYVDSLGDEERIAYSAMYTNVLASMTPYFVGMVLDEKDREIAENEALLEDVYYSAEHDPLTKLLNSAALQRDVESRMRLGTPVIYHMLDLDAFKAINDTLGHDAGDEVLKSLGDRLRAKFQRHTDTIAHDRLPDSLGRRGGDEFAVVSNLFDTEHTPDDDHTEDADRREGVTVEERVARETAFLQSTIDEFVAEQRQEIRELGFGISVGTAYWDPATEPDLSADKLIRRADLLMYAQKNRPFRVLLERHREDLEMIYSTLAGLGISARDLPKVNPYED